MKTVFKSNYHEDDRNVFGNFLDQTYLSTSNTIKPNIDDKIKSEMYFKIVEPSYIFTE